MSARKNDIGRYRSQPAGLALQPAVRNWAPRRAMNFAATRAWVRLPFVESMRTGWLALVAAAGIVGAAIAAYFAAVNPGAAPPGPAAPVARVAYVLAPLGVGIYAWRRHSDERLGPLLIVFAAVAAIWTLNGSSDPTLFSVARIAGVFVAPLFSYVVLSFPEGRLHSRLERWVVAGSGAIIVVGWVPLVFITRQPTIATPLVRCAPHCAHNIFFAGTAPRLERLLTFAVRFGYVVMLIGVLLVLVGRLRSATAPMRRMLAPVLVAAILYAGSLALYLATQPSDGLASKIAGSMVIVTVPLVPLALLLGFMREQVFVRSALQRLVAALPDFRDDRQIGSAMAAAFNDDTLQIVYWRAADRCYVDRAGTPVQVPEAGARAAVTRLQHKGEPVAAILHDPVLIDDSRFLRAIAAAAMVGVDRARLEADLHVSRRRLVHAADAAREEIERNLHDGAQQQLVGLRVSLQLAAEAIESGSDDAAAMVTKIGVDMETAVEELRRLAQGIYPPLLARHGLDEALHAASLRATLPATVEAGEIGRYDPDIEAAVYFCCVEALQNADKHAGAAASVAVRLWCLVDTLRFEVADTGAGFEEGPHVQGAGLTNMRDRIGAVGGQVTISSVPGGGTSISGVIPTS